MYAGYTESDEKIAARKARILESFSPNLSIEGIPEPGYCSPLAYAAMTSEQRAEYDRQDAVRVSLSHVRNPIRRLVISLTINTLRMVGWLQQIPVRWAMWQASKFQSR